MAMLPQLYPCNREEVSLMRRIAISFMVSVLAGVAANYVYKLLVGG